ncbi:PP2C family protein-serine/threonine phosphatase [Ideonella livida]|uniref:Serine/threonine-protein phosphatase n=1 Tax=Ideonella livida TaxID=2707176 RepID=A0A7C9PH07_9BURK|nr:PP2C family serine/threonine-protein phosphatase [Ideonella livida]NDY91528.1 serine/threonine-protein phosphatase [Ideonella livida]
MRFSVFQISRKGGREKNEDRMGYCYTRDSGLFALADGMGGHPEGEVASQMALQVLANAFQREAKPTLRNPIRFLQDAILAGHHALLRYATERSLVDTPRTTVVACVIQAGMAYWAHCGDSRLYLVRGNDLVVRTRDHSYTELQQSLAHVVPMDARYNRSVLFTCLGSPGKPVVDTAGPVPLHSGDRLIVCSDGLWSVLTDTAIVDMLSTRPLADAVPEMVEQALRNGGTHGDNVTVLAVEWEAAEDADTLAGISTRSMGEDVFASTIQATLADTAPADLDEAEIERSIREINEAIQRTSRKSR